MTLIVFIFVPLSSKLNTEQNFAINLLQDSIKALIRRYKINVKNIALDNLSRTNSGFIKSPFHKIRFPIRQGMIFKSSETARDV